MVFRLNLGQLRLASSIALECRFNSEVQGCERVTADNFIVEQSARSPLSHLCLVLRNLDGLFFYHGSEVAQKVLFQIVYRWVGLAATDPARRQR